MAKRLRRHPVKIRTLVAAVAAGALLMAVAPVLLSP
jgi:hypothetical protein